MIYNKIPIFFDYVICQTSVAPYLKIDHQLRYKYVYLVVRVRKKIATQKRNIYYWEIDVITFIINPRTVPHYQ